MAKYDVELITDKHGKPMPQYFDEVETKMKPITKDNFDGTINGSVDVEFPDVQKVEVTNQVDEVSIKELPNMSGTVEVTNLPHIQDVNVTNAIETVSIDNLPSDYPDQAVEARLQAIEQTQSQILNKLNDTIDTRLTGSIDEYALPVELSGDNVDLIRTYFDSMAITDTDIHNGGTVPKEILQKYSSLFLMVNCNLGKSIRVRFYGGSTGFVDIDTRYLELTEDSGLRVFDESANVLFITPGAIDLNIRVQAVEAPTTGSISVTLYGKRISGGASNANRD